jgi:hypothetical protein
MLYAGEWKENKLPNIARFKLPFQPCTRQGHENDDAFFVWKNIEYWNGDAWTRRIEEVAIQNIWLIVATLVHTSMFTSHIWLNSGNNPVTFNVDQRNIVLG